MFPLMDDIKGFAERLKTAMLAAGYEPRPSVLEANFNSRFWGKSVTFQAARRWLLGQSIPTQDKLEVLARWLEVDPHALRYGRTEARVPMLRELQPLWMAEVPLVDRGAIQDYLALPAERRRLIRELIKALQT